LQKVRHLTLRLQHTNGEAIAIY